MKITADTRLKAFALAHLCNERYRDARNAEAALRRLLCVEDDPLGDHISDTAYDDNPLTEARFDAAMKREGFEVEPGSDEQAKAQ